MSFNTEIKKTYIATNSFNFHHSRYFNLYIYIYIYIYEDH